MHQECVERVLGFRYIVGLSSKGRRWFALLFGAMCGRGMDLFVGLLDVSWEAA